MRQLRPGHRQVVVQTDTPMHLIRWDTAPARRVAGLFSIDQDLTYVVAACARALECDRDHDQDGMVRDDVALQAFWQSALVAYVRCVGPDGGDKLTEADAEGLGLGAEHRRSMDLRNLHVAHRVDPHWEQTSVAISLSAPDSAERSVIGMAALMKKHIAGTASEIADLQRLALALREKVKTRLAEAQSAVIEEAKAVPVDRLYAYPSVSTPDVETTRLIPTPRRKKRR